VAPGARAETGASTGAATGSGAGGATDGSWMDGAGPGTGAAGDGSVGAGSVGAGSGTGTDGAEGSCGSWTGRTCAWLPGAAMQAVNAATIAIAQRLALAPCRPTARIAAPLLR
jgi:hypothetical protein